MGSAFSLIVEFIPERLYFGVVSPDKCPKNSKKKEYLYFKYTLKKVGLYFGPPHIGLIYKYIKEVNRALNQHPKKTIIHVAFSTERKLSTNAALLMGCYAILQLKFEPAHVAHLMNNNIFLAYPDTTGLLNQPRIPLEAFFYGLKKGAIVNRFIDFKDFNIREFDRLLFGLDASWIVPDKFLAFATLNAREYRTYFRATKLINYFRRNNVTAIIRLTKPLYDSKIFTDNGFEFYDMFFPDCTAPPFELVEEFLEVVENTKGAVALHCFAGLGRTGTMIACYLIKHFDFTALEATTWCRLCRFGSVIGIQHTFLERHEAVLKLMGIHYRRRNSMQPNHIILRPICGEVTRDF